MRATFLYGFAIFTDFLQLMIMLSFAALQVLTPVGGGAAGVLSGCYINASAWYDLFGCIQGAFFGGAAGGLLSAFALPIGGALDIALSLTFGGGLMVLLAWNGMFYPGVFLGGFIGENIPFLDALFPGWTFMVWKCLKNKKAEEAKARQVPGANAVSIEESPRAFDGIRAANDNQPYVQQAA